MILIAERIIAQYKKIQCLRTYFAKISNLESIFFKLIVAEKILDFYLAWFCYTILLINTCNIKTWQAYIKSYGDHQIY